MAKKIVWSPQAEITFHNVVIYLKENWTEREVLSFIDTTERIILYISKHPRMFRRTNIKDVHEALVTSHNLLIYKVYPDHISLITFYDTRQHPNKKKL